MEPETLQQLARTLLALEREVDVRRAQLLAALERSGVKRVDVEGEGHVVYVAASTSTPVDVKACVALLEARGVAIPMGVTSRRAGLRVNPR